MERNNETRYILLTFLAICFLATGGIFIKLSSLPPIATGVYRVLFSIPILLPFISKELKKLSKRDIGLILLAGMFFGGDLILWNISFTYTTVANASLLANLVTLTMVPASYYIFKEKIPPKFILSIMITIAGVIVLLSGKINPSIDNFYGDFLAFITSFFYAAFLLMVYKMRDRVSAFTIIFVSSFSTAATMFVAMIFKEGFYVPTTFEELYPILGLALCSQIAGQGLMSFCLGKVRASLSSVLVLSQPIVAAIYALIIFSERLSMIEILGMMITLIGIYVAKKSS